MKNRFKQFGVLVIASVPLAASGYLTYLDHAVLPKLILCLVLDVFALIPPAMVSIAMFTSDSSPDLGEEDDDPDEEEEEINPMHQI